MDNNVANNAPMNLRYIVTTSVVSTLAIRKEENDDRIAKGNGCPFIQQVNLF
jgi:hypothetical protein